MKDKFLGSYRNYLLLLIILLVAYLPLSSFLFALKNDAFTDNFPDKFFFSSALHGGHLPLWNPYMNFGFPIYADPGFAFYNPITWLFGIIGYNAFTFTIEVLLYIYLAGVNMYLLCTYLSFQNRVCLAVASMFMCSGFFVGNLQHINFLTATAFVPLVVKYLLSSLSNPSLKNSFYLAIAFFFVIMGGHPAIPIATVYFMLFIVIAYMEGNASPTISSSTKVGYLLLAALVFISLSIPIIYSYTNILPVYSSAAAIPSEKLIRGGTSFSALVSLFIPYSTIRDNLFYDTDLSQRNLYFSIIAFLFLIVVKPKKETILFTVIGSILFLFSVGGGVKRLIYSHLPGLNHIRINGEFRMFTILSLCIAAGYNLNYFLENPPSKKLSNRLKIISISLLSILSLFMLFVLIKKPVFTHLKGQTDLPFGISYIKWVLTNLSFPDCLFISLAIATTFITAFYILLRKKLYHLIPFLIIIDVALNLIVYIPITGVGQKSVSYIQAIYNRSPKGIPVPTLTPVEKLDSISTDESNLVGDWSYYNKQIGSLKITDYPSYFLSLETYFNSNYPSFINKKPFVFTKQEGSKISIEKFSPQNIEINCTSKVEDTLYLLQNNYKYWKATVDGNRQPISTAFYSFMAIAIPKGESKIVFLYQDWGLLLSFIISFIILCSYLIILYFSEKSSVLNKIKRIASKVQNSLRNISQTKLLAILGFLWVLIQASYFKKLGIVTTLEATKYIDECQQLLHNGYFSDNKYLFYSVYIFIHIVFYKLGFEITGVYIFQLLLNLLAAYLFFKLCYKVTQKKSIAFIAVLLLLLTQTFQMWTVYLYTESVFSSLLILFTYSFFALNRAFTKNLLLTILLFVLLILARPTGLLLIPVLLIYFLFLFINQKEYLKAILFTALITLVFVGVLNYAMQSSTTFNFVKPFIENQIICDVPTQILYKPVSITSSNTLVGIFDYIMHNKKQTFLLAYQRFISYWGMQRSTNSRSHNLFFACFFYPIYLFGVFGAIELFKREKGVLIFITSTFIFFTFSVMISCDEWSNRFIVPIIPFVMMLGAIGIHFCYEKMGKVLFKED